MGFPNRPITMIFPATNNTPLLFNDLEGFQTGAWWGNNQFGGYPAVGQHWRNRADVEAYAKRVSAAFGDDAAPVIDVEQWQDGHFADATGPEESIAVLGHVVAWIRPYFSGPILFAAFWAG